MYIQDRVLESANELFNMIEDEKTHIYLCGLKGMEPGIDEAMTKAAEEKGLNWSELRPQLKKAEDGTLKLTESLIFKFKFHLLNTFWFRHNT